jgi:hypothetical protein
MFCLAWLDNLNFKNGKTFSYLKYRIDNSRWQDKNLAILLTSCYKFKRSVSKARLLEGGR